jgi:hypothetical protein
MSPNFGIRTVLETTESRAGFRLQHVASCAEKILAPRHGFELPLTPAGNRRPKLSYVIEFDRVARQSALFWSTLDAVW